MDAFLQDIKHGFRSLVKNPAFALIAIFTLALGIGANTAIFSVVNSVLLKPLPYPESERIFWVQNSNPQGDWPISEPEFVEFQNGNRTMSDMAAIDMTWTILTGQAEPTRLVAMRTTAGFFPTIGIQPEKGRAFTASEDTPGNDAVVVVSHGLWKRTFGSDPSLIGRTLLLDGKARTVIGIMPDGFHFLDDRVEMWIPLAIDSSKLNQEAIVNHNRVAIGRLKPGITVEQANEDVSAVIRSMGKYYPNHFEKEDRARLKPLREEMVGDIRPALLLLLGAVGFVLLIACVNVANLFLARGESRQKEVAIRTALGAGLFRNIRLLITESLLIAFLGGSIGFLLSAWGLDALQAIVPAHGSQLVKLDIDKNVLLFTFLLSAFSGLLFGLAPAFQISRTDVQTNLKDASRGSSATVKGSRLRQLLVVSEIALAVILVVGAGLLIRSLYQLQEVNPGFQPKNVLVMQFDLPEGRYSNTKDAVALHDRLIERVHSIPSVKSASISVFAPLLNMHSDWYFEVEGRDSGSSAFYNLVSPDYFTTLGIPLIQGRFFTKMDQERSEGAVVINEAMAKRFWPNQNPLGRRINVTVGTPIWREVVGVVGNVKNTSLDSMVGPQMYFPLVEVPFSSVRSVALLVRTTSDPLALAKTIKGEIQGLDRNLPVDKPRTMEEVVSGSVDHSRFAVTLLTIFASLAVVLASIGIYGVISYSVARRTHELGVRMALGAERKQILKLVVRQGMILAIIGLSIGIAGAFVLARTMRGFLFEVSTADPLTFVAMSILFAGISFLATYVPARRAASVDPITALRYE